MKKNKIDNLWTSQLVPLKSQTEPSWLVVGYSRGLDGEITISLNRLTNRDKKNPDNEKIYPLAEFSLKASSKLVILLISILRDLLLSEEEDTQEIAQFRVRKLSKSLP